MSTEQNYVGKGDSANPSTQTDQNQAQPLNQPYRRQTLTPQEERSMLDSLRDNSHITEYQRDWGKVVTLLDDRMAPRINKGAQMATYLLDPSEFKASIGAVVAIDFNEGIDTTHPLIIGRLKAINNRYLYLSFDNPAYPDERIERKRITINGVFRAIWLIGGPIY